MGVFVGLVSLVLIGLAVGFGVVGYVAGRLYAWWWPVTIALASSGLALLYVGSWLFGWG